MTINYKDRVLCPNCLHSIDIRLDSIVPAKGVCPRCTAHFIAFRNKKRGSTISRLRAGDRLFIPKEEG